MPRLTFGRVTPLVKLLLTPAFVASGQVATGTVRVADWPRARDAVVNPSVEIGYRIEGGRNASGRPMLTLTLSGTVEVVCQRSLHPMPWRLGRRTTVLLARDQQEADVWDREVEDAEVVVADQALDAGTLLEDEFLLSLPFAPLCDDPACAVSLRDATVGGQPAEAAEQASPFAALKGSKISKSTH